MRFLGRVVLVQVQAAPLKVGKRPDAVYDPAPLTRVERVCVTPGGVVGVTAGGDEILDVHHAAHGETRQNSSGVNGVSVNFSGHYQTLRARFGGHLTDGCAGENILVEAAGTFTRADLDARLVFVNPFVNPANVAAPVTLSKLTVAAPCVEFGAWAAAGRELPGREMRDVLDFLHHGRRGFYATLESPIESDTTPPAFIRPGDLVYAAAAGPAVP